LYLSFFDQQNILASNKIYHIRPTLAHPCITCEQSLRAGRFLLVGGQQGCRRCGSKAVFAGKGGDAVGSAGGPDKKVVSQKLSLGTLREQNIARSTAMFLIPANKA
jgi:hypothetical protein